MSRSLLSAAMAAFALAACGQEAPTAAAPAISTADPALAPAITAVPPLDYAQPAHWLCRPDADDACEQVATVTLSIVFTSTRPFPATRGAIQTPHQVLKRLRSFASSLPILPASVVCLRRSTGR